MKRGSAIMVIGISIIIMSWIVSAVSHNASASIKGTLGYVTIIGWVVFFGGFGLRQLDKRKSTDDSIGKKKSL